MFQLVICPVTTIDYVFNHKDGFKFQDLRRWVAVVSACTVLRLVRNTCGRFKLAWRHLPCWYCSVPRWGPTWLPARGVMQPVPLPQVFSIPLGCRSWFIINQVSTFAAILFLYISLWAFLSTCSSTVVIAIVVFLLHFAFTSHNPSYSLMFHFSFSFYVRGWAGMSQSV